MDSVDYSHFCRERKRGEHLTLEDRGAIAALRKVGLSLRKIAGILNASPSTIHNELLRGTPSPTSNKGRRPCYSARHGQSVYDEHRRRCRKPHKVTSLQPFVIWVSEKVKNEHWSLDACVGYARRIGLFSGSEMVCTKTLYNALHIGFLPLTLFDVPNILKRRKHTCYSRTNRRLLGRSIEERPLIQARGHEFGHWEIDTVLGRKKRESCILTLAEKQTNTYLIMRISGKQSAAVYTAMQALKSEYGSRFCHVFKTITSDNGSEFSELSQIEKWGTKVYFSHPYSSWERPQNERLNGILRYFIPKGASIDMYSDDEILRIGDTINAIPRRSLDYQTPEVLFERKLDEIYAI